MKKITCGLVRVFSGREFALTGELTPEAAEAISVGIPTLKRDGTAVAVIGGVLHARYDAKHGKAAPAEAIPCQDEPDAATGHWPHWVKASRSEDRWIREAASNWLAASGMSEIPDGTYEACGPRIGNNKEALTEHTLFRHGAEILAVEDRTFGGLKRFLEENRIEGIVFWLDGEPRCKVRRSDYGLPW